MKQQLFLSYRLYPWEQDAIWYLYNSNRNPAVHGEERGQQSTMSMAGHGGHLLGHSNTECGGATAADRIVTELMWSLEKGSWQNNLSLYSMGGIQRSAAGGTERGGESATFILY